MWRSMAQKLGDGCGWECMVANLFLWVKGGLGAGKGAECGCGSWGRVRLGMAGMWVVVFKSEGG